jgi:hypothetical protein
VAHELELEGVPQRVERHGLGGGGHDTPRGTGAVK